MVGVQNGQSFNQGTDFGGEGQLQNATLIEDFGSFVGVRGAQNVDPNLEFLWQIEQYITLDHSQVVADKNTWANKDSFLGLKGDFGILRIGRISVAPKSDMAVVDPWTHDSKGVNGLSIFTRLDDGRLNNALKYESPEFLGMKVMALYSPDEKKEVSNQGKLKDKVNAALLYKDDSIFAGYSYYIQNNTHAGGGANIWERVEVAADSKIWMLVLGYQKVKGYTSNWAYNPSSYLVQTGTTLNTEKIEAQEWAVTLNYTFQEKLTYRVSYAMGSDLKVNDVKTQNSGYNQVVLGAIYFIAEKAKTFLNYGQVNWKGNYIGTQDQIQENSLVWGLGLEI